MEQYSVQTDAPATCADEDSPTFRLRTQPDAKNCCSRGAVCPAEPLEATAVAFKKIRRDEVISTKALDEWTTSFGGPREHAQLFRELHRFDPDAAFRLAWALTTMPPVGTDFFGFHLLAEIGRGGMARVYLAEQAELANRHVVLKVAPAIWGEADRLAQLQHPNIVPVFSMHQHEPFQAVCMPYLGWTTLQDVLFDLLASSHLPTSGRVLGSVFKRTPVGATGPAHDSLPAANFAAIMARMSYVEAVVWLAVQIADGLAHAHEHGIVHHDLKPANILLTDDGVPMLLDFNAAEDTKSRGGPMTAWVAGTLPYMAPEQLAALQADRSVVVDARSDLYSFGVILFELLTRRYPFEHRNPAPTSDFDAILEERRSAPLSVRNLNPAVSPALEAIVRRCLAPDPGLRYETARQLQEDLHRQHTCQTLLHTVEPSRGERLQKWRRRHPRIVAATLVALCAGIIIVATIAVLMLRGNEIDRLTAQERDRVQRETELIEAESALRDFHENLKTVQFLLYTRTNEPEQLASGVALATKLIDRYGVHENPDWQQSTLVQSLPNGRQRALADSMAEVLLLLGRAQILRHDDPTAVGREEIFHQVLLLNERAAACSEQAAASPALWHQRAKVQALLGAKTEADRCREHAKTLRLRTAADHYWLASDYISGGRLRDALPLLQQATRLDPASFWAWFVLGNCCDRLGLDARAEACYGTCIALKPDFHWSYFNRGLALYRQQDYRSAIADFDTVVASQPKLAEAYLNRALCRQWLRQYREAEQDLSIALEHGGPSRIYFLRARAREKLGDRSGARRDNEEALRRPPTDEKSWIARGIYRLNGDPKAALADFEQALRINQRSADALQNQAHVLAEKLGRTKESLNALNRLLELYPDSVKARSGRGVVLARLGQREPAIRDAKETLRRDASPPRLYQVACIYALTSKQQPDDHLRAFQLLLAALRSGYGFQYLDIDHDLDPIRPMPEFRRLSDAARALRSVPSAKKK